MLCVGETQEKEDSEFETYLLLLLSDSNLPTGGFVASSGLESYYAHGLLQHNSRPVPCLHQDRTSSSDKTVQKQRNTAPSQAQLSSATLSFAQSTLHSYSRSSFPFLSRVHFAVKSFLDDGVRAKADRSRPSGLESAQESATADIVLKDEQDARLEACLSSISRLDHSYHTLLLNHVARRASKAQGIALLTLYSKAFAKPINLDKESFSGAPSSSNTNASNAAEDTARIELAAQLVERLKLDIRRSAAANNSSQVMTSGRQNGHLPICWAVFSACLGLSLQKAAFLHLFLQARSLFSSSIRLNTLGPYLAHQVMRFQLRGVVEGVLHEMVREGCLTVPEPLAKVSAEPKQQDQSIQLDQPPAEVQAYTLDEEMADRDPHQSAFVDISLSTAKLGKPFRTTGTMSTTSTLRPPLKPLREGKNRRIPVNDDDPEQGWAWDWDEDQDTFHLPVAVEGGAKGKDEGKESGFWTAANAPATTFPLGEIVQARHDQLHSRLFNS
ncbi:uncharacterized protein MEPE_01204 [Melanopsichium pennsylvanicum]|uniref:Uncharacterized protein n=2 Tax=Melanopsichium pennsylvanicum TaxID=63383 RepID=A0AAJ5C3G2_9BASI|nr:urease accessory protein [Melanopsichium pennsylvanicum 4]SNX82498.1 uncharacterized protein MEPE_01204 [Melanopsichium pennsylvanicum]